MTSEPSTRSIPTRCVECQRELDSPAVCGECHTLYPVDGVNYFDLLGLEFDYDLDPATIQQKYLNLARAVHPDRLHADSAEVERLSLRTTSQINEARKVLICPVLRAGYMLELCGGPSPADDKSVPQQVLADTLMLREEIEDAQAADDQDTLDACRDSVQKRHDDALQRVATLARSLPGDEQTRTALRHELNTIRYYQKILEQL